MDNEPENRPIEPVAGTLLLVDDDPALVEVLADVLELDGYRVLKAFHGAQALEIASREQLDAILLDVGMPDMDGFQVMRELQKQPRTALVPILFVTAEAIDSDEVRRGLELGVRDYIPKPTSKPELLARVSSVVRIYRMERELRQKNESLRELDRRRREYLSMASHDIKSPLATVSNYCTLLMRGGYGGLEGEQLRAVQRVRSLVDYMRVLVNNLLDLEKIEEGSLRVELEPCDPQELIEEAFEVHRVLAGEKQITLAADVAPGVGRPQLDRQRMLQVINNLVGNALKFCPAGASVTVSARPLGGGLEVSVSDTGPGIPLEEQSLLFRPFQQLSVRSLTEERGAGLGLCIVKNLVELHGGKVAVDSSPGRGTRFVLTIPERQDGVLSAVPQGG
ncbi:MAG: hybrid sensor histidine kinase/response regulator [Candidatus Wallbacteria bacterium]|nr:hybrid sensor histidine kinase/response regulator [Candidatus Wallbacteria bacterium]